MKKRKYFYHAILSCGHDAQATMKSQRLLMCLECQKYRGVDTMLVSWTMVEAKGPKWLDD